MFTLKLVLVSLSLSFYFLVCLPFLCYCLWRYWSKRHTTVINKRKFELVVLQNLLLMLVIVVWQLPGDLVIIHVVEFKSAADWRYLGMPVLLVGFNTAFLRGLCLSQKSKQVRKCNKL